MSYYIYYLEIKNRLFLSFLTWVFAGITCYFYKEILLFLFVNSSMKITNIHTYFIFTNVTEIFSVYLQLVFFISNQILLINVCYHLLMFLSPGLYKLEYSNLKFLFNITIFSWITSVILLNKLLLPLSWNFFISFQEQTGIKTFSLFFEAKINEYLDYYIGLYYVCLLNCQFITFLTLFINSLSKNLESIKEFRKIFYYVFVIFSTLITPPDIISQLFVSFSLIAVYELLIFLKIWNKINKVTS
jgi:sec-independent protein translocase protein TatC